MQGGDLLAAAQTGTGKTAGFTLPILHRLLQNPAQGRKPGQPRVLILTPTRELTAQVEESVRTYSKHTSIRSMVMFGGVNINPQISALRSEEHTSELQSLMRTSYAVFCLKKQKNT